MKNTLKILAAVLALSIGSAGYVASAEAAMMKMDHKMMMKGHHGKCMMHSRHGKCRMMHTHMMMKHPMTHMMKKY